MEIYQPAEDSYIFADFLREYLSKNNVNNYLDMGTGSGILSEVVSEFLSKDDILAVDLNLDAVEAVMSRGVKAIESDLFESVEGRFDLITFNAPYLPLDEREPEDSRLATTGGDRGDEISVRFLEQVGDYLNEDGKVFLLVSSLTPMENINLFKPKVVFKKKIFEEELIILGFDYEFLCSRD
jgi:release factor glutamine methyltransferase